MLDSDPRTLVSTDWLSDHMDDPNLRILDGSWYLPTQKRDPKAEYLSEHIPGARFFDIDDVADHRSDLPHMAPPIEKFMSRMRKLGIGDGHQVVVYDGGPGIFSAARVWWTFRLMGQMDVAVLDGGLAKWKAEGRKTTRRAPTIKDRHMVVDFQPQMIKDVTQVAAASKLGDFEIIDARSKARFDGAAAEPRQGLRSGHIPGSKNLPFTDLFDSNGLMLSVPDLKAKFLGAGVDLNKPIITSCGSGVTASVLALALERMGVTEHAVYDGSWTEWGAYPGLKVATKD